jgi:hypothetical protein
MQLSLRFSNKPVVNYGNQQSNPWARFPQGAQPIASAPQQSAQAIVAFEPNGKGHYAMQHRGQWIEMGPNRDSKTGAVSWRMNGTVINAVAWMPIPRKK